MKDLVIVGAGGHAREIHQLVQDLNADGSAWNFVGFLDEHGPTGREVHGYPVLGAPSWLAGRRGMRAIVAIGDPVARRRIVQRLEAEPCASFATLVHPRASVGRNVTLGEGSTVCAGAILTTDITVGRHVILNVACTVAHDATIDDFVTVAPGVHVCGAASVMEGCDLGTACTVIPRVSIGPWTVVGAGAVVVADLPPNVTAVGLPARPIKQRENGWHRQAS
jgi:sugar O-acyltransferase (sialic acid O-acetyltransferase NeuD family)